MTELSALNIRITGDSTDLKAALAAANGDLAKMVAGAEAAGLKVENLGTKFRGTGGAGAGMAHSLRGVSQQLSQVGQQTMATGNFIQALAIQLPDIGLAFGAIGTAAGLLAGIALPMLVSAFTGAGAESDELKAKQEALKAAIEAVTEATENYRLERAMGESGAQTQNEQVLLNEVNRLLSERAGIEAEILALTNEIGNELSAEAASQHQSLSIRLASVNAKKEELDAALAALDVERATNAEIERKRAKMQAAYEVYGRTRAEGQKIAVLLGESVLAAQTLSQTQFDNISTAAGFAAALRDNMQAAAAAFAITQGGQSLTKYGGRSTKDSRPVTMGTGEVVNFGSGSSGFGGGGGGGVNPLASELEALQQSLMTQEAVQLESYTRQQETLRSALDQRRITHEQYAAMIEQVQMQHEQKLGEIQSTAQQQRLSETAGLFGALAGIAQSGGERMAKAAAAFQAIEGTVNAYGAAIKALNTPGISLAGRFAAYASVLAAGLKGVAAIRSAGGIGGGSGAAGAAVTQGASQGPLQVSLNTFGAGDFLARADLGGLLDNLNKTAGDRGYRIMVPA